MYSSYAQTLSVEHSLKCRRLIESDWYRNLFGDLFSIVSDRNTMKVFENDRGGYRYCTSVGGTSTGVGGSILVCDDPNSIDDAQSAAKREAANLWWSHVWSTRLNDPKQDVKIIVQQRAHFRDITGTVISNDSDKEWIKLILPNEFEPLRRCVTVPLLGETKPWADPREKAGELLSPDRFGEKETRNAKKELGEIGYAGQYQQVPSPATGALIKESWFGVWKQAKAPPLISVIQSWDFAVRQGELNDYSVATTWGIFSSEHLPKEEQERDEYEVWYKCAILLSMWRGKVGYPDLRKRALRLYHNYLDTGEKEVANVKKRPPHRIIMEDTSIGQSLIDDLKKTGLERIIPFNPKRYGDKISRVHFVLPFIENKRVYLRSLPPKYESLSSSSKTLLEESTVFPKGEHDDIVDTLSQFLLYCREGKLLKNTTDKISTRMEIEYSLDDIEYF